MNRFFAELRGVIAANAIKAVDQLGVIVTGLWLLVLYAASVWLVLAALSAYQLQSKIQATEKPGTPETYTPAYVVRLSDQLDGIADERSKIEDQVTLARALVDDKKNSLKRIRFDLIQVEAVLARQDDASAGVAPAVAAAPSPEAVKQGASRRLLEDRIVTEGRELSGALSELEQLDIQRHDVNVREDGLLLANAALQDVVTEMAYFQKFRFILLVKMPRQLLTLILALTMGSLGSVILLTREYLLGQQRGLSWYIFRPLLGMVTAFTMFVLAKAGLLVVSGAPALGAGSDDLNPFFISFLAIISGLLSELAYGKIEEIGKGYFRVSQGTDRWAYHLRRLMSDAGLEAAGLAPYLDASEEQVNEWINEERKVPESAQRIIAARLNTPVREIFSDLGPG